MINLKINVATAKDPPVQIKKMAPGTIFFFPNAPERLMLRTQEPIQSLKQSTPALDQAFVALDGQLTAGRNHDDLGILVKEATLTVVY